MVQQGLLRKQMMKTSEFVGFRKDRPAEGQSDKQSPNGSKMKAEMQEVHESLLVYTQKAVGKSVMEACGNENLKRIKDN